MLVATATYVWNSQGMFDRTKCSKLHVVDAQVVAGASSAGTERAKCTIYILNVISV